MRSTTYLNKMALTALLMASVQATAQTTSFVPSGSTCMSQNSWTQKALEQTDVIASTLQAMAKDPNCKQVAETIGNGKMFGPSQSFDGATDAYRSETIMQELASLRDVLMQKKDLAGVSQVLSPVLADATVETIEAIAADNQSSAKNQNLKVLKERAKRASAQGVQVLNSLFQILPQNKQCMEERPDLSAALLMGGVRVASAFAMGDMGMSTEMAEMTSNFLKYLRDAKFSKIQKSLNEQKVWSEVSCLVESTQASYCAVQDGFNLLKIKQKFHATNYKGTPLEGFSLMSREVPMVTEWLNILKTKLDIRATSRPGYLEEIVEQLVLVDQYNFIDESVVGTKDSVRTSLVSIRSYLSRLYGRLSTNPSSQPTLMSLLDTVARIDRILEKFKELDNSAKSLGIALKNGNIGDLSALTEEVQAEQLKKITELIKTLIKDFQLTTAESTLLSTRFATYVRQEYDVRLVHEDFSKYSSQLLASARGTVEEKLKEYQKLNIAEAQTDLAQASTIQMANLDSLETLAGQAIEDYLVHLNNRAGIRHACAGSAGILDSLGENFVGRNCSSWFATKQDKNNEAEILRAKVCLQTLGFKDYQRYAGLCRGAVLKTNQVMNGRGIKNLQLEFKYNDMWKKRYNGETWHNGILGTPASNRFSQVCLLRDYFRNNFVNWLTLRYQDNKR